MLIMATNHTSLPSFESLIYTCDITVRARAPNPRFFSTTGYWPDSGRTKISANVVTLSMETMLLLKAKQRVDIYNHLCKEDTNRHTHTHTRVEKD